MHYNLIMFLVNRIAGIFLYLLMLVMNTEYLRIKYKSVWNLPLNQLHASGYLSHTSVNVQQFNCGLIALIYSSYSYKILRGVFESCMKTTASILICN